MSDVRCRPKADFDAERVMIEAVRHHANGDAAEAEDLYGKVLDHRPDHARANYNLGLLLSAQGRLHEAQKAYRAALAAEPDYVDAKINLGTVLLLLRQPQEAVVLCREACLARPDDALARGNLGKVLQDLGRIDEAVAAYHEALSRQPDNAVVHTNLGGALLDKREWNGALTHTRRSLALKPDNVLAWTNLGTALLHLQRYDEALGAYRRAVSLGSDNALVLATLGGAMVELGALEEAEQLCRRAVVLDPGLANAHFNLSQALKALNRTEEAVQVARAAIALVPDSADYHFHLGHLLLLRGEFEAGWAAYEWRWKLPDFGWLTETHGVLQQPRWMGEDIGGKTILVVTEQGLGDVIQFARYLPLLVQRAGRVIVAAHRPLRRLLATIDGLEVVPIEERLPDFDVQCPLLSLPMAFGPVIPATVPYFRLAPKPRTRGRLRVGIVWAGNTATKRDRFRSPGLQAVLPLFAVPNVDFVVLQVGPGRDGFDLGQLPPGTVDAGRDVADLVDTAAIMAGLDLVISSCTGPLHLAGALGVPAWAMIPFAPHFTWMLERTDSSWYPSIRLYRQDGPGQDWSGVVARIAGDLTMRAEAALGFNELAQCRDGMMLFNRNDIYIGASLRKYGEFSAGETALFKILVQPGMTVLDVGANIGVHTVDLSRLVGPHGAVHAFEPQRLMFQVLCANVALNSCANVFTHRAAVGAEAGTLLVPSVDPDREGNYGGVSLPGTQWGEQVPVISVDSLALPSCHIIKVDVEGMETEALQGARATVERFRPILYVENDRKPRSEALIALIQSFGYRLYWHMPMLYSAENFNRDPENIFGNIVSMNMLCLPAEIPQELQGVLHEVTEPMTLPNQRDD